MRLPTGLVKHSRAGLKRALLVAVVFLVGGGEGAALALLPADRDRHAERRSHAAAPVAPATAAPTPFEAGKLVAARAKRHRGGRDYYRRTASRHVAASAGTSFMALYREAERTFGVSWRLIASIHRQETAFSTAPTTYHGLNAFGCCAGPMQFNVKNGPVSTWELYRQSFSQGNRPRSYPHRTRSHPSVYDDFDAIMAAGALLRDGGAGGALDSGSWSAAYAYYGHDLFGIEYANQVLGRAQAWEIDGFCLNCPLDEVLVGAFDDAYGADARRELLADETRKKAAKRAKSRAAKARKRAAERRKAREKARRSLAGEDRRPAPKSPPAKTTPAPPSQPQTTTTSPPEASEPAPEPAAPAPAQAPGCTKLERLLGCRD
jgi:hypothetical protein